MFEMKKILKRLFCLAIAVVMLMSTAGAEGTSTYMAYRSNADDIQAENKIDNKNVVVPVVSDAQVQGNVLNVKMKPNSFVVYRF